MSDTELSEETFDNPVGDYLDETDIGTEEEPVDEVDDPLVQAVYNLRAPDFSTRRTANISLARASVNAIPALLDALADADESFTQLIMRQLTALGPDALLELLTGLQHPEPQARQVTAGVLGTFEDSRAIPALIDLLNDSDEEVQRAAASALEQINTLRALEAVNVWKARSDPQA